MLSYAKFAFLVTITAALATCAAGADARFMYLTASRVPRVSSTGFVPSSVAGPAYGIGVYLDSDNLAVNAFRVTVEYRLASGMVGRRTKVVPREERTPGVAYGTMASFLFDSTLTFTITRIEVDTGSVVAVTRPEPGRQYSSGRTMVALQRAK